MSNAGDLRGKKVGVPGLNSLGDVMFRKWLLINKVAPGQVSIVEAPFPQMKDLLKGGTLDAVIVVEPFRSRITSDGTGYKVSDYASEVNPDFLAVIWMAKSDWAAANPTGLRAFREALAEAMTWIPGNSDEAKAIEAKYLGVAAPGFPAFSLGVEVPDLEFFMSVGKELGLLRQPIDVNKLIWK